MDLLEPLQRVEKCASTIFALTLSILHVISNFLCLNISEKCKEFVSSIYSSLQATHVKRRKKTHWDKCKKIGVALFKVDFLKIGSMEYFKIYTIGKRTVPAFQRCMALVWYIFFHIIPLALICDDGNFPDSFCHFS